ncbi:MAG: hypothetical protein KR126chlam4_00118 [Candidatus Anoxychlamydiales bacterium]|uniref:Uncharacterized protein n=1 Tax=marine sediment metagenome TaxID=412755 RepID=A0A0F9N6Q6_9ZZZZ|nr:hypothetical protein [Candidatus Anoxychlamydiales bacterium]NGX40301.1 hypothetical protein [Candidatus Anoxychlamydiales bacterium]HEU63970.1 hypothetical protein [Chlamydiota bacterium]
MKVFLGNKFLSGMGLKDMSCGAIGGIVGFIGNIVANALIPDEPEKPEVLSFKKKNSNEPPVVIEESFEAVLVAEYKDKQILTVFQAIYGKELLKASKDELFVYTF